uniref:non-specific serine/threonine protein kinase n=1 Tax=Tanacetum cinerariifolium TaxID=118510 RepID=A0A6L2L5F0_TANCI|nr:L-type lectin-domain containing receptor kinase IX.1-like [Tanacetum cinerariifolium]
MAFSRTQLISYVLLVFIHHVASLTFNFTNIRPQNQNAEIVMEGVGAKISDDGIQLTPDKAENQTGKAGRATYFKLLHLWDSRSGELASFTTNFTFVIDSNKLSYYGDGLTFFMSPNNTEIYSGGSMGLPVTFRSTNMTDQFVAVEFDTFWNRNWDPLDSSNNRIGDHVGISINSLASVSTEKWLSNVAGGGVCQAWIAYDSSSKNFSVSFTGYRNNTDFRQDGLHYVIDLKQVLPEWVIFGFSAATGALVQKNIIRSWTFKSSDLPGDENNELPPPIPSPDPVKSSKIGLMVGLIVGIPVGITFLGVLAFVLWRKNRKEVAEDIGFDVEMNNEFQMGSGPKRFSYYELARSTGDFSETEKLGEGGFGGVYRGFLKDSESYVAVKRVSKNSKQGIQEYASEVMIISRLRHRNLVQLEGWCHEKGNLLLVYEYMENGSLDSHLFKEKSLLTWGTRYKIVHGLASALMYLHEEWEQCVLHRDIKSSNVMLDSNFNAKLGDFGLAKLVDHEKGSETTKLAGTMGYMAPECVVTGKATKESDIFSFGVVALEIACGRKPLEYKAQENQIWLLEWVWELYGAGTLLDAADQRLGSDFEEEELKHLMIVGLWCVHPDSELRPTMRQVIQVLNSEASLPTLPSKMPISSYWTPSTVPNQSTCVVSNIDSSNNSIFVGR